MKKLIENRNRTGLKFGYPDGYYRFQYPPSYSMPSSATAALDLEIEKNAAKETKNGLPKLNFKEWLGLENSQVVDINQIANQMQFLPTSKKKLMYQFAQDVNNMQPMTYAVSQQQMPVVTMTSDGKETQNTAEPNDIIMSGPSGEKYVIKAAKFPKLYVGQMGGPVHPEQSPRNVAVYTGQTPVNFTAPWGESMVLKPGDYLVKEAEGKYYRIAKKEYEMTYNPPGKIG